MLHFPRWKSLLIIGSVVLAIILALPNAFPQAVRDRIPLLRNLTPMVLGLDLQGGSHLLLEVDRADLENQLSKQLIGDIRQTLREQKVRYSGLGRSGDGVSVRITEASDRDRAYAELQKLSQPVSTGLFGNGLTSREFDVSQNGEIVVFRFTPGGLDAKISRAIQQSLEILDRRINASGMTEPTVQRQGVDRILIQVPGLQDPGRLKQLLGQTARLQFRLLCDVQPEAQGQRPPPDCEDVNMKDNPEQKMWVQTASAATVEGEDLTDAQPTFDSRSNEPVVSFRFNQKGALRFGRLTQENVGKPFAIVLDNAVVSAPVINEPILGGTGQISGRFTSQESTDLAIVLRSGALPAKLIAVEERSVGPSLGSDSIRAGVVASVIGLIAVFAFMLFSYGLFGIFANIALVANLAFLMGILSVMQATLTLPGIAGIVLTMGMAVDSNVLVFERIREEWRSGRSTLSAIEQGFTKAFATILDANLTTLLACLVLFGLGSGPIRGFAITLALGIFTTIFTAYTLTRFIVAVWVKQWRPKAVPL
jgi:protein-export membrane protein SecD